MPLVLERFPDLRLLVAGSGEEEESLRSQCHALGLEDKVVFAGAVPNRELAAFYADADIFVSPSLSEGFGLTFVEAGMSGCILVGTDVGGVGDIIEEGRTGFLVPEKDPEALARAVIRAIELEEHWPEMRERTRREFVARFDWQVVAARYGEILVDLAARRTPGSCLNP